MAFLETALNASREAILAIDRRGRIAWLNHACEDILALPHVDWEGKSLRSVLRFVDEETRETRELDLARLHNPDYLNQLAQESVLLRHDEREFPFEMRAEPVVGGNAWILFIRDVFQTRLLTETVSFQRSHDALTGTLNRAEFERVIQGAVEDARINQRQHAIAYLDLDQFKVVNNTCGHFAGDELLRQITELLRLQLGPEDVLARLGGDEFGLMLWDVDSDKARLRAEQINGAIHDDLFVWGSKVFSLASSIGLAMIDTRCDNWAGALRHAEIACNHAKQTGANRVAMYREDDRDLTRQATEMEWVSTIVQALQNDRFELYAQPIVPLSEVGDSHLEILVRMRGVDGSIIPPGAFLPAAERYNLSLMLDRWVVTHTLRFLAEHPALVARIGGIAINLSGASIGQTTFQDFLIGEIGHHGIDAEKLCFEVTETSAVSNLSLARNFIGALKDRGCRFALDDFGAGMSSFAYLKNLPVDYLKIDGLFVRDIMRERIDYAMVKSINDIGHVMSMKTIAEFVENEATMKALRAIGVDFGQGYGIAKPAPLRDFLSLDLNRIASPGIS